MMILQEVDIDILLWIQEHLPGGCPDSIMESDYFSGKRGMVLDRGECAPDLLWKNAKGGNNSSAFAGTGISHYESAAEKYRCPSKTF